MNRLHVAKNQNKLSPNESRELVIGCNLGELCYIEVMFHSTKALHSGTTKPKIGKVKNKNKLDEIFDKTITTVNNTSR